jgi:hypothetical protein
MVKLRVWHFAAAASLGLVFLSPSPNLAYAVGGQPPTGTAPIPGTTAPVLPGSPVSQSPPTPISAGSCPAPAMGTGGPAPTSISGPFAVSQTQSGPQMMQVGTTLPPAPIVCEWVISYPSPSGDPTVTVYVASPIQASVGSINEFAAFNNHGVSCEADWELLNPSGGGLARSMLSGGTCNTDGFVRGEGTVEAFNGDLEAGPTTTVAPQFGAWYNSEALGAPILEGQFSYCSEDPVGQHNTYACLQFDAGPFE